MPYRKTKRTSRRKAIIPSKYRSGGWVGLAKKALYGVKSLRRMMNVEYKYFDKYSHQSVTCPLAGAVYCLSDIAAGVGAYQRNGNSILLKSIYFTGYIRNNGAQIAPVGVRLILFVDKQAIHTAPAVTDVLVSANIDVPLNLNNGDRFKILADKRISLAPTNSGGTDKIVKLYKKLYHHCKFNNTTALAADLEEGHVYVLIMSDQGSNTPTMFMSSRLRFIDN